MDGEPDQMPKHNDNNCQKGKWQGMCEQFSFLAHGQKMVSTIKILRNKTFVDFTCYERKKVFRKQK